MRSAIARHPGGAGVVVVVAVFLALLGARMFEAEPVRGDVTGFHQRVQTDRTTYAVGDTVRVTYTVCRTFPWPARTSSTSGTDALAQWQVVDETDQIVAGRIEGRGTLEGRTASWLPGQCRRVEIGWDQHPRGRDVDNSDPTQVSDDDLVPPGSYRVEVWWLTGPTDVSFGPQSSVSSEPFQIEP
jgi:hypothetical protein